MQVILETERLFLRKMTMEDFDSLYVVLADSDIMQLYPYALDVGLPFKIQKERCCLKQVITSGVTASAYSYCKYTNIPSIKTAEAIGMHFYKEYPDEANEITHVSVIYREDI